MIGKVRGKVAAALTVAFFRNAGEDTTLQIWKISIEELRIEELRD